VKPSGTDTGTTATTSAAAATAPVATAGMGTRGGDQPRRIGRSTAT